MSNTTERPKSQYTRCLDCKADILQKNPDRCPYCGSLNLSSEEEQFSLLSAEAELEKALSYEAAASSIESIVASHSEKLNRF